MDIKKVISHTQDFINAGVKPNSSAIISDIPIIVIAGPTATGKSSLAIKLAKEVNGYIINADSRQIYDELKIGTAQPIPDKIFKVNNETTWIIDEVEHYLYGTCSISKTISSFEYKELIEKLILKKWKNTPNLVPILVGGTGMYIDTFIFNYQQSKPTKSQYTREKLNSLSLESLQKIAGEAIEKLNESDRKNQHRLIRLIERNGENLTKGAPMNYLYFIVSLPLNDIEQNIKLRVNEMFDSGLLQENVELRKTPEYANIARTIGYQEFDDYFTGKISIEQVKDLIVLHTRQYAKRQITWFKRNLNFKNIFSI